MFSKQLGGASLALSVFLTEPASAYWRMSCMGVAGIARIDPIVSPNEMSGHVHTIKGASGLTISSTVEELLASNCTSCEIAQDKSAYWSPALYFMDSDGTVELVPETNGHLTYYKYVPATLANGIFTNPKAIPNGMKMVSGDTWRRNFTLQVPDPPLPWSGDDTTQDALAQKAVGFNCLNYAKAPEGSLQRHFLPSKSYLDANCTDGVRMEVLFPICWNGKDLDSPDFKSHVAYSDAGLNGGNCPRGFDVVINQLFFETIYPVQNYKDRSGYFSFANGDPLGYGYHADAFIAWEEGVLQNATDLCGPPDHGPGQNGIVQECPIFDVLSQDQQQGCKIEMPANQAKVNMETDLKALPGINPIQTGPQAATPPPRDGSAPPAETIKDLPSDLVPTISVPTATPDRYGHIYHQSEGSDISSTASAPSTPTSTLVTVPSTTLAAQLPATTTESKDTNAVVATSYYTSAGAVYEFVVVEVDQTVTVPGAESTGDVAVKRDGHHHHALHHVHHNRRLRH